MSASTADAARRPRIFTPGTPIGMHLRVERVVRIAGDRVYYLVNNHAPRWYTKKCWVCGNKHSPPSAQACTYCSAPLRPRRFMMCARWDIASALEYQAYVHRRLKHKTLGAPLAVYRYKDQLLACFAWDQDQLLLGEPAPLSSRAVLSIGFQLADALSVLHAHGVILARLDPGHVLIHPSGAVRLFDLEVARLVDRPLPARDDRSVPPLRDVCALGEMLEMWAGPSDLTLLSFLREVRRGTFRTADALASAISTFAWTRSPSAHAETDVSAISDRGVVRPHNEDHWGWRRFPASGLRVHVVADGMGGHGHGAMASHVACRAALRTLTRTLNTDDPLPEAAIQRHLTAAIQDANRAILELNKAHGTQMGTTVVALVLSETRACFAHLGDSRLYLLRDGELKPLSEDHSVVAARVAAGTLKPEEAADHDAANLLLYYVGQESDAEPDLDAIDVRAGDRFLLCSDGLWGEVDARRLRALLMDDADPRRVVRRLVRAANDAGGRDNVTAMVVDVPFPGAA